MTAPLTKIVVAGSVVCLGDIYVPTGEFRPINYKDLRGLRPLALLTVGFPNKSTLVFEMLGYDSLSYTLAKRLKDNLRLLNHKGKVISVSHDQLPQMFTSFSRGAHADIVFSMEVYLRTVKITCDDFARMGPMKMGKRLNNLSDWPEKALKSWAVFNLHLPNASIPETGSLKSCDRLKLINNMIKTGILKSKSQEISKKIKKSEALHKLNELIRRTETISTIGASGSLSDHIKVTNVDGRTRLVMSDVSVGPIDDSFDLDGPFDDFDEGE